GGGRATAMSRAENRNRVHSHFAFRVRNVMERRIMGSVAQLSIEAGSVAARAAVPAGRVSTDVCAGATSRVQIQKERLKSRPPHHTTTWSGAFISRARC